MRATPIYIKASATLRHLLRDGFVHGVMGDVLEMCLPAPCASAFNGGDVWEATQGGGGIDHPKKVQQNKAQTDILFFCTLLFIISYFLGAFHLGSLLTSLLLTCTRFMDSVLIFSLICVLFLGFGYIIVAPRVLTTLESNLGVSICDFSEGGGISYPVSIID